MDLKVIKAYRKIDDRDGWAAQMDFITDKCERYHNKVTVSCMRENQVRNRYNNVKPFDHSRVKLKEGTNDYINSNFVTTDKGGRRYILAQGPLENTSCHFWQMVWEQNSKAVVMLNKTIEKGANKCHHYWPTSTEMSLMFVETKYSVTLVNEEVHSNYVIRKLVLKKLSSSEPTRTIYQFHYTSWPDFGVPVSPDTFLEFMFCVQKQGVLENSVGPAVVHCSAGIGRSGTFVLIETCSLYLQENIKFDVSKVLLELRKYRMGLIQTPEQLRFSYLAIAKCEEIYKKRKLQPSLLLHPPYPSGRSQTVTEPVKVKLITENKAVEKLPEEKITDGKLMEDGQTEYKLTGNQLEELPEKLVKEELTEKVENSNRDKPRLPSRKKRLSISKEIQSKKLKVCEHFNNDNLEKEKIVNDDPTIKEAESSKSNTVNFIINDTEKYDNEKGSVDSLKNKDTQDRKSMPNFEENLSDVNVSECIVDNERYDIIDKLDIKNKAANSQKPDFDNKSLTTGTEQTTEYSPKMK